MKRILVSLWSVAMYFWTFVNALNLSIYGKQSCEVESDVNSDP